MAYYNKCPNCGANLDPGETCDCMEHEPEESSTKSNDAIQAGERSEANPGGTKEKE